MWLDSLTCVKWLFRSRCLLVQKILKTKRNKWVTSPSNKKSGNLARHSTLSFSLYDTLGWLRLVGSLNLQVSFAKEPCKRDDILQKRPIILRSLRIVANIHHIDSLSLALSHACSRSCALALALRANFLSHTHTHASLPSSLHPFLWCPSSPSCPSPPSCPDGNYPTR